MVFSTIIKHFLMASKLKQNCLIERALWNKFSLKLGKMSYIIINNSYRVICCTHS